MHQNEFSALRAQAGISLDELAELMGYSARQVRRWDKGEGDPPPCIPRSLGVTTHGQAVLGVR